MKNKVLIALVLIVPFTIGICKASSVKASTFGWTATNATSAFVNAIKSATDTIIIDLQTSDWMINPTSFDKLKNKTIIFENGVNLVARLGAFNNVSASLFMLYEANNIKIIGYGATFKMQKAEYVALSNSEQRHCIRLTSCSNIEIYGLKLMDSGGDGIIISNYTGIAYQRYCENVLLKDIWCDNNYRQGISIISAQHLRVENCWFTNTSGTAPQAGVDIEPNNVFERLIDIVFDKCRFIGNAGGGIKVIPISIDSTTLPMDITFNNCYVANNGINRYQIETYSYKNGAKGNVRYNNCMTDGGTYSVGGSKLVNGHKTIFTNCVFRNPTDIVINLDDYTTSKTGIKNGGMSFTNCLAFYSNTKRFFNVWHANTIHAGLDDVQFNNFTVINPNNVIYNHGGDTTVSCVFNFQKFTAAPATIVSNTLGNSLIECNNTNSQLQFSRNTTSNTSYPIAMTYGISNTGVQGVDYSRMKGFEIIKFGSLSQADTFFVLVDSITEITKQSTITMDTSWLYTSASSASNVTIADCGSLSISEINANNSNISIYPNPAADILNISINSLQNNPQDLLLYNSQGQLITKSTILDYRQLNISNLPVGLYYISVRNSNYPTRKFIKQ